MNITHYRKPQIEQPARGRPRQYADRKQKQTAHVERMREQGVEIGTIGGLSKKGDAEIYQHIKRAP